MGKKYIIELEDKPFFKNGDFLYRVKGFNSLVFDMTGIGMLTPYTEPDLEKVRKEAYDKAYADAVYNCSEGCSHVEQVRQKAYKEGVEDGKRLCPAPEVCNDMAYQKGLSDGKNQDAKDFADMYDSGYSEGLKDAWEAARKLLFNKSSGGIGFNAKTIKEVFGVSDDFEVLRDYSAAEVIEKIRQYEQAQKELEQEQNEEKPIRAEDVMRQYLDTFCKRNFCTKCLLHTSEFTCGRGYHFLSKNPVSDEEVRRAYAKVVKE